MKKRKGFTLIELLVTIVILGIVTTLSIPLIRNIQTNNDKKEYTTYMEFLKYSAELYIDSYGEDLFGRNKTGCRIITYNDLFKKKLIKDIPIDNVSCATDRTFVRVVKLDGKYGYAVSIGCGPIENKKVKIDTLISNVRKIDENLCKNDANILFDTTPDPDFDNKYKKRSIKLSITSQTGINNNLKIYYGFSLNKETSIINNNWKQLKIDILGKKEQKKKIYAGKIITIESEELTTPEGVTGDLYLVLRIDKLENLAEEPWSSNEAVDNKIYIGTYRVDNTKPNFNDSTIISSESTFNSVKPQLKLNVKDEYYSINDKDLSMCISYDSDKCPVKVAEIKNGDKYKKYEPNKILEEAISNSYNSSSHNIFITVADAAGNYEKKVFPYRVARAWTLTYNSNGGSICNPSEKTHIFNDWEKTMIWGALCQSTRTNFEFLGWKTKEGNTITSTTPVTSNLEAIGDWKALFTFSFRYTGKFSYKDGNAEWVNDENNSVNLLSENWQVKFLTSGTLTVLGSLGNIDAFLVGGGGGAGESNDDKLYVRGGAGGGGGFTTTKTNIAIEKKDYEVTIGNGGAINKKGETTKAFDTSAAGGNRGQGFGWLSDGRKDAGNAGSGGSGGGGICGGVGNPCSEDEGAGGSNGSKGYNGSTNNCSGNCSSAGGSGCATNGGCKKNGKICTNTRAFCESNGELYAGGGAGGDHENIGRAGAGGGAGGVNQGIPEGGHVGDVTCRSAVANTGGGGTNHCGGKGASGIVIIRNSR